MKGKSKYIVPLILAGVTASAGVVTTIEQQQQTMVQAKVVTSDTVNNLEGAAISLVGGFEDNYDLGSSISMPDVRINGVDKEGKLSDGSDSGLGNFAGYNVTYKIYRGNKNKPVQEITAGSTDTFVAKYTGAYDVEIVASKGDSIVSTLTGLKIVVEKAEAVINLPVNSNYVIPAKLPVSNAKGLTIPAPTVSLIDNKGVETEADDLDTNFKVKVITPNKVISSDDDLAYDATTKTYKLTSEQLATAGTYQIRYEYYDGAALITKLETNFQVVKNYTAPSKLFLKLNGSVPATGNVNKEITLPKVKVLEKESSTDGINAHITVKVTKLNSDNSEDKTVEITDYENYKFVPTEEGDYVVSYQADLYSIYDNVDSGDLLRPETIIKVSDKANPTVMATYAYNVVDGKITEFDNMNNNYYILPDTEDNVKYNGKYSLEEYDYNASIGADEDPSTHLVSRRVDIPSVVVRDSDGVARFRLPAIYGTDNVSGYSELKFIRQVTGTTEYGTYTVSADANEWSEIIEIKKTGNYEIRYKVIDGKDNSVTLTCPLVIKDKTDVADGETNINLNIGVSSITNKETLKFNVPTATDTYDSYLDIKTEYVLLDNSGDVIPNSGDVLREVNKDNKYEINIDEVVKGKGYSYDSVSAIRVITTTTADRTLVGTRADGFKADTTEFSKSVDIAIRNIDKDQASAEITLGDDVANVANWNAELHNVNKNILFDLTEDNTTSEVIKINEAGYALDSSDQIIKSNGGANLAAFNQGNNILTLPSIRFTDEDENLGIILTITDKYGNVVTKEDYEQISKKQNAVTKKWEYSIEKASFRLSASGVYTVTYKAQDTAGNVVVKSFGIRVNDKTAPTIVIDDEDKYGSDIEVGDFFEVPLGRLIKDGKEQDGKVTWTVTYSDGAQCMIYSTGFVPLTEGTFYITYTGIDDLDNTQILKNDSLFYVNSVDTTDPVFNEDSSYILPPTIAWEPDSNKEMKIDIPRVEATDPIRNESLEVTYTVEAPNGSKLTVEDYTDADKYDIRYFVADRQGIYKITYTVTDAAGNKVTKDEQIAVGDCDAPTIDWKDGYTITDEVKLGDTWSLDLSKIDINDEVSDKNYLNENVTIKLVKPDGSTKVNNIGNEKSYKWKFEETGTYTLHITVRDEAGNTYTDKFEIEVPDEDADKKVINSVVGTVLVVVSVVILAGVVIYFVVSSRKKTNVKKSPSKKNK